MSDFWECLPHLLRICRNFGIAARHSASPRGIVSGGGRKISKRSATKCAATKRPAEPRRGVSNCEIADQCFFVVVVEPIVAVPVVPGVGVAVVPDVDVAVVEVMAVPEVSVDVPLGMAEVEV